MFSPSLDHCEIKENEGTYKSFVEAFRTFVAYFFTDPTLSLSEAAFRVLEVFRLLRQKFLEMFIFQRANDQASEPVVCPKCEEACRPWCSREWRMTTLCGVIRVERWVSSCACGHYAVPWDAKQKLRGQ